MAKFIDIKGSNGGATKFIDIKGSDSGFAKFIVFEGIDGSGKTTQIKLLSDRFKKHNIPHIVTKEPTDGPIGKLCRSVLSGDMPMSTEALALLFMADRAEHISSEILPALESGKYVLCDRYEYSNMAYQGIQPVRSSDRLDPDLTIFIDTDPEECTRRILHSRPNFEIYDGIENAKNIRAKYIEDFRRYKDWMPVEVISGVGRQDDVLARILQLPVLSAILSDGTGSWKNA